MGEWEVASSAGTSPSLGATQATGALRLAVAPHPTLSVPCVLIMCMLSCFTFHMQKKNEPTCYLCYSPMLLSELRV